MKLFSPDTDQHVPTASAVFDIPVWSRRVESGALHSVETDEKKQF